MNPCRRRTLTIFGGLACLAALFVPYRSIHVTLNRDPGTNTVWKRTHRDAGYMFLFHFLGRPRERPADAFDLEVREALRRASDIRSSRYELKTRLLAAELAAIAFLAAYDFFFLCRRKRRKAAEAAGELQGGPG
jgi:hypothetical protein